MPNIVPEPEWEDEDEGLNVVPEPTADEYVVEEPQLSPELDRLFPAPEGGIGVPPVGQAVNTMVADMAGALGGGLAALGAGTAEYVRTGDMGKVGEAMQAIMGDVQHEVADALEYDESMQTETGGRYTDIAMKPFEWLSEGGEMLGEFTLEGTGSPLTAAGARILPEAAAFLLLPALLRARRVQKTKKGEPPPKPEQGAEKPKGEEPPIVEEIVLEGDAPLPGAQYFARDVNPKDIVNLPRRAEAEIDPAQQLAYAQRIANGKVEPNIIVEFERGKPKEIIEGGFALDILNATEQPKVQINVVEARPKADPNTIVNDFSKVEAMYNKALMVKKGSEKISMKGIGDRLMGKLIDVSWRVRHDLLKKAGDQGKLAVMHFDNIHGAPAKAHMIYKGASKEIWEGLNHQREVLLNKIIASRRVIQVDKYKGEGKIKHSDGLTRTDHEHFLQALEAKMGKAEYYELQKRADKYFEATNRQLVKMKDEGLIDQKLYDKLKNLDYSLTKYIETIDPVRVLDLGGKKITVHDSGIEHLKGGAGRAIEIDARELLAQTVGRSEARMARARANTEMYKLAQENPGLEWLSNKNRSGLVEVEAHMKGKTKKFWMEKDMAEQWIVNDPQLSVGFANFLRTSLGGAILRPLATGYNPEFALVNFPRDIMHIWTTTPEYSPHLPIFMGQMTRDLVATGKDAFRKSGRYEDFVNEGGGMNFLTHQGQRAFHTNKFSRELQPRAEKLRQALSYVNETSEIWTRLALRERALRNGKTPTESTWVSRSYMDFARGGSIVKGVDNAIPYLNAATQAFRGAVRHAKDHPGQFAMKAGWLMTIEAQMNLANWLVNRENWEQTPDHTRRDYWVFTTPMQFTDDLGYNRHVQFRLRKDNTITGITGISTNVMTRSLENRAPTTSVLEDVGATLPYTGHMPPAVAAMQSYTTNKNWYGSPIWKGPRGIDPLEEYYTGEEVYSGGRQTSKLAIDMARTMSSDDIRGTRISPARLEEAMSNIIPKNMYTDLMGAGWKMAFQGMTPMDRSKTTEEFIAASPMVRKVMKLTHPISVEIAQLEDQTIEPKTEIHKQERELDQLYFRYEQGELNDKAVESFVNQAEPKDRERLGKRFMRRKKIDSIFKGYKNTENIPSKFWWLQTAGLPAKVRADVFYQEWRDQDQKGREQMQSIAHAMHNRGLGYKTDDFVRRLQQQIKMYGREYD